MYTHLAKCTNVVAFLHCFATNRCAKDPVWIIGVSLPVYFFFIFLDLETLMKYLEGREHSLME